MPDAGFPQPFALAFFLRLLGVPLMDVVDAGEIFNGDNAILRPPNRRVPTLSIQFVH